jgi:hypothetical protein
MQTERETISGFAQPEPTVILTYPQLNQIIQEAISRAQGSMIGGVDDRYVLRGDYDDLKSQIKEHELRLDKQSEYIHQLRTNAKAAKPGKKSDQRKKALANMLLSRKNEGMTFAEIGKFLELGSRKNGKSTREQNMTHFGKLLSADKKCFIVTDGKTNGGFLVKLTKIYYDHLLRGEV